MMEETLFSKTSVPKGSKRHDIPEDGILHRYTVLGIILD
jgi:hypothetical protein